MEPRPMPSYFFRILSLVFWVIVVVVLKNSPTARSLFGHNLSWLVCIVSIFWLWLLTILVRAFGLKIILKITKEVSVSFIKQLPFLLAALAASLILILIGRAHSSPILMFIGAATWFLSVWVINWPKKEWYKLPRKK